MRAGSVGKVEGAGGVGLRVRAGWEMIGPL